MKLEDQVCAIEYSQRLCELGVKQESLFYWVKGELKYSKNLILFENVDMGQYECYSAFSVAELGELLSSTDYSETVNVRPPRWIEIAYGVLVYREERCINFEDRKEADARAKLLIHLLENGLMELPK